MESMLLDIFRVKLVARNTVLGSLGTQRQAVSIVRRHLLTKHTSVLNQNVGLKCLLS